MSVKVPKMSGNISGFPKFMFWKHHDCRYQHPRVYEGDRSPVEKKEPAELIEMNEKNNLPQQKKQCWNGKRCKKKESCTFDHTCRKSECMLGRRCKYEHEDEKKEAKEEINRKKKVLEKKPTPP